MKKIAKMLFMVIFTLFVFVGCSNEIAELTIDKESVQLEVGEEVVLTAVKENTKEQVEWFSSAEAVAGVSDGKVLGLSIGEAIITARCGAIEVNCQVKVVAPKTVGTLTVDYENITLSEGAKITITSKVTYKNNVVDNLEYHYLNSDDEIINITQNKNTCIIEGISFGEAKIIVTCLHLGVELKGEILVEVKKDISLELTNVNQDESGYNLDLVTFVPAGGENEYINEFTPEVKVLALGEELTNIEYYLSDLSDNGVIEINEKSIKALKFGDALVEIKYIDESKEELKVIIIVHVTTVNLTIDNIIDFDKTANLVEMPKDNINGEIIRATLGEQDLEFTCQDNTIELREFANAPIGEHDLIIETSLANYKIGAFVVTKIINTKEDLDMLATISKVGEAIWDGYYVLGSDIDYNGVFQTFCGNDQGGTWGGATGFIGTFDGRGHLIKGFKTAAAFGGLFGTIANMGVVKNVGFLDAEIMDSADRSGIVASFVYGTIENVFVEVKQNGAWWCGGICEYAYPGATLNNNMIIVSNTNGRDSNFALTSFSFASAIIKDCYSIGSLGLYRKGGDTPTVAPESENLRNFLTLEDMKNANLDLTGWNKEIWDLSHNVPLFKGYLDEVKARAETEAIKNNPEDKVCGTLEIVGSNDYKYSLKEPVEGITILGNIVTIVGNYNSTFTVVATHVLDSSIVALRTFTTGDKPLAIIDNIYDIDLSSETTELEILNIAEDLITKVIVDDSVVKFTQDGNRIVLSEYSSTAAGCKLVTLEGESANYQTSFLYITRVINNVGDWETAVSQKKDNVLDGYYVLNTNLDYTDIVSPTINEGLGWGGGLGFVGTFDGRGHMISNVTFGGDQLAFFGTLGSDGLIKNVAFKDCTISWGGQTGIVTNVVYGTIENVEVEFSSNGGWWTGAFGGFIRSEASISNCMVRAESVSVSDNRTLLGACIQDITKLNNCYGIGMLDLGYLGADAPGAVASSDAVKKFATLEDMKNANIDLSSWNEEIWDLSDNIPKFR